MAKRNNETGPTPSETGTINATSADAMEQRVLAFAAQLGRMAGTIQAKTEGWMDRRTLNERIGKVRDGAAHLLEQLAAATKASKKKPVAVKRRGNTGRSGGVVDAPGKKHRRRTPDDPTAKTADSQAAKLRTAKTMVKTNRHRGRG